MRTNKIRLTESQLHKVIKESVQSILNEISYETARATYDKMEDMGQIKRAKKLSDTYSDINDDEYAHYNLANNNMSFMDDNYPFGSKGNYWRNPTDNQLQRVEDDYSIKDITGSYEDFKPKHRTDKIKAAQAYAKHMNNFTGTNNFTRNHFRS